MRRPKLLTGVGVQVVGLMISASALADGSVAGVPHYAKRQLADCMTRRMVANHTVSYNDASKACKDELQGRKADAASLVTAAPKPVG